MDIVTPYEKTDSNRELREIRYRRVRLYPNHHHVATMMRMFNANTIMLNRLKAEIIETNQQRRNCIDWLPDHAYIYEFVDNMMYEKEWTEFLKRETYIYNLCSYVDMLEREEFFMLSAIKLRKISNNKRDVNLAPSDIHITEKNGLSILGNGAMPMKLGKRDWPIEPGFFKVRIRTTKDGSWWADFMYATSRETKLVDPDNVVGIDLGLSDFAVDQFKKVTGEKFSNKMRKMIAENIERLDKVSLVLDEEELSVTDYRFLKATYHKLKTRVARMKAKLANKNRLFVTKLADEYVDKYDVIALETLLFAKLDKGDRMRWFGLKLFSDEIIARARLKGKVVIRASASFASTHTCSATNMNLKDIGITLSEKVRKFDCPFCKGTHDRDINAAHNLANLARNYLVFTNMISMYKLKRVIQGPAIFLSGGFFPTLEKPNYTTDVCLA